MHAKKTAKKQAADSSLDATQERLSEVLSTFATLREDGRALIDRIHTSLLEMRDLRHRLREQRAGRTAGRGDFAPARTAYIQMQFGLTARETEVAMLLAQGLSNVAVAKTLAISNHTARHHTQRVLGKLKVHSRAEQARSSAAEVAISNAGCGATIRSFFPAGRTAASTRGRSRR
jgi:DNA-binding NarL/FixJ family response regulator